MTAAAERAGISKAPSVGRASVFSEVTTINLPGCTNSLGYHRVYLSNKHIPLNDFLRHFRMVRAEMLQNHHGLELAVI